MDPNECCIHRMPMIREVYHVHGGYPYNPTLQKG